MVDECRNMVENFRKADEKLSKTHEKVRNIDMS